MGRGAGCAGEPVRLRCPTAVVARGLLQLCIPPWGHARCVRVARMSPPELNIIKYDFIIKPGGNPNEIKLKYNGLNELYLQEGNLHMITSVNSIVEQHPYAYQIENGEKVSIPCEFELEGNVMSFEFPDGYNNSIPLIIDPKLIFSAALKATASSVIICHNHPSGNLKPSQADIRLTQKLVKAGEILELSVLDHLIITKEGYYSLADEGLL